MWLKMSRIERNDRKTSNSGKKIKSFWQNGKKEPFFWLTLYSLTMSHKHESYTVYLDEFCQIPTKIFFVTG